MSRVWSGGQLMTLNFMKRDNGRSGYVGTILDDGTLIVGIMLTVLDELSMYVTVASNGETTLMWDKPYDSIESATADFEEWAIDYVKAREDSNA